MKFRLTEVDATEDHYNEELTNLHDLTFFDPSIRADFNRGWWWLLYEGPTAVGFCGLTITYKDDTCGYLKRAGVLKHYRGHGLQRRMITLREKRARKLGLTRMITDTTDNPASANSLIGAGYRLFEPEYRWAFKHSLYWRKDLTRNG